MDEIPTSSSLSSEMFGGETCSTNWLEQRYSSGQSSSPLVIDGMANKRTRNRLDHLSKEEKLQRKYALVKKNLIASLSKYIYIYLWLIQLNIHLLLDKRNYRLSETNLNLYIVAALTNHFFKSVQFHISSVQFIIYYTYI